MAFEDVSLTQEDATGTYALTCRYEYDEVTLAITGVEWQSTFPYDLRVYIEQEGLPLIETVIRAGRSGKRPNIPGGQYRHGQVLVSIQRSVRTVGK